MGATQKFLLPDVGPSHVGATQKADYQATKPLDLGMFSVGSPNGVAASTYTLDFNNCSSTTKTTLENLFLNTLGGVQFFGMVPPPSSSSRVPPAIGPSVDGQFNADWKSSGIAIPPFSDLVGAAGATLTYNTTNGAIITATANTTALKYAAFQLPKVWPNLIYKLEYKIGSSYAVALEMGGTWIQDLPYTGTFTQSRSQNDASGSPYEDGLITLDTSAAGTYSLYFAVPEYGQAASGAAGKNGWGHPGIIRVSTINASYSGTNYTYLEYMTLTQIGSLYRFNSLDITKNSNSAYTVKATVEENLATALNSPKGHPQ